MVDHFRVSLENLLVRLPKRKSFCRGTKNKSICSGVTKTKNADIDACVFSRLLQHDCRYSTVNHTHRQGPQYAWMQFLRWKLKQNTVSDSMQAWSRLWRLQACKTCSHCFRDARAVATGNGVVSDNGDGGKIVFERSLIWRVVRSLSPALLQRFTRSPQAWTRLA